MRETRNRKTRDSWIEASEEEPEKRRGQEEKNPFESGSVPASYVHFALPVVLGMAVSLLYNMVDTYFIARTGNPSLVAGVALGTPVFTFMIALGDIFGLGGSSLISRLFGQGREEDARRIHAFCFYGALGCGVLVAAVLLLLRGPVLSLLGASGEVLPHAGAYYSWYVLGAPAVILKFTPLNILRTEGLTRESMTGSILGTIVNIVLDPLFIFTFGMGAAGAAIATVLGNLAEDAFYLWVYAKKSRRFSLGIRYCSLQRGELGGILSIGIPASVTNLMQSLGTALTYRFLLPYGTERVAAMGIAMKVSMVGFLVMVGFAFGGQPLFGYFYGARKKKRLREILRFAYGTELLIGLGMAGSLGALAPRILSAFMEDEGVLAAGVPMLRFLLLGMPFVAVVLVTTCVFQSTGKALGALLLSLSRQGLLYFPVLLLFSRIFDCRGVIASQAASDFLTALLALFLFQRMLGGELTEEEA